MHAARHTLSRSRLLAVVAPLLALLALSLAASAPAMAQSSPVPSLSISDPSPQFEGSGGVGLFTFVVTLSDVPSTGASVSYRTVALDAEPGGGCSDFAETSGSLVFSANNPDLTKEIHVTYCGDGLDEADERFSVELFNEDDATVVKRVGTAEIIDDDSPPSLELENATVTEPDTGATANATFNVRLSEPSGLPVTFNFAPTNLTASGGPGCGPAGVDHETTSGTRTIPASTLTPSEPVRVTVCGDLLDEADETFRVKLQPVVNASNTPQATGTITDDDPVPALSINNPSLTEGDAGTSNMTFKVSLSAVSGRPVSVGWSTANGTAHGAGACNANDDYLASSGTLTIPAGASNGSIIVPVCGDRPDEVNEKFRVTLASPSNATGTPQGTATINDNDPPPRLGLVSTLSRSEGDTGETRHVLIALLVDPRDGHLVATGRGVSFKIHTLNAATSAATGGATCGGAGVDYETHAGTADAIGAGFNKGGVELYICGDPTAEQSERFSVRLSDVQNATVANATSLVTILNDDGPDLVIGSAAGAEGSMITFPVRLIGATSEPVRVDYETRDGTAHSDASSGTCGNGNDYRREAGTLVFPASNAGMQTQTITVSTCADHPLLPEGHERFTVRLSRPDFARITVGDGTGVIVIS